MVATKQGSFLPITKELSIKKLTVFYREYARRNFFQNMKKDKETFEKFLRYYIRVFNFVLVELFGNTVEVKGIFRPVRDVKTYRQFSEVHFEYEDEVCHHINDAILMYNNREIDNPALRCESFGFFDPILSKNIVKMCKNEVEFLHNTCMHYGYFPGDLLYIDNIVDVVEWFTTDSIPHIEPFLRFYDPSNSVWVFFVSSSGVSYFEKEDKNFFYLYCNSNEEISIESTLNMVKAGIGRKGKKNYSGHIYINENPNIQLKIKTVRERINKKELSEVKYALMQAVIYFNNNLCFDWGVVKDLYWRTMEAAHKKISYKYRCLGLYIWDCVHFLGMPVASSINKLIDSSKEHDDKASAVRSLLDKLDGGQNELDYSVVDREYRLADQCIKTLSVLPHGRAKA